MQSASVETKDAHINSQLLGILDQDDILSAAETDCDVVSEPVIGVLNYVLWSLVL